MNICKDSVQWLTNIQLVDRVEGAIDAGVVATEWWRGTRAELEKRLATTKYAPRIVNKPVEET